MCKQILHRGRQTQGNAGTFQATTGINARKQKKVQNEAAGPSPPSGKTSQVTFPQSATVLPPKLYVRRHSPAPVSLCKRVHLSASCVKLTLLKDFSDKRWCLGQFWVFQDHQKRQAKIRTDNSGANLHVITQCFLMTLLLRIYYFIYKDIVTNSL